MNPICRISIIYLSAITLVGCLSEIQNIPESDQNIQNHKKEYVGGTANVLFSESVAEMLETSIEQGILRTKSPEINSIFDEFGVTSFQRLFPHAGEYEPRTREAGLHRWYRITYNDKIAITKVQTDFMEIPGVEIFEPTRRISINSRFNDPKFDTQWHYFNDGSISYEFKKGADINVSAVWENFTTGDRSVVVAVVDEGVDYLHEDLAANYINGKNFGSGGKVTPGDHGTHVAGTIAAINNNGIGVSGIAGGDAEAGIPGVGILSCQIFAGNLPAGEAEAIKWAADNGAVICNNSWGYTYATEEGAKNAEIPSDLKAAIDYFIQFAGCDNDGKQLPDSPMQGGVVICAAGNDAWKYNPIGEYEPVVAVGAIGPDYTKAYYSSYGEWVDIAAPGGTAKTNEGMVYSTIADNGYGYMQGTSMACPHVSGAAALIVSYFGGPGFTNEMLLERLIGGANKDILPSSAKIGPLVDVLGSFTIGGTVAPDKVEDFDYEVVGNNITLKINVTGDKDDVKTYEYIVLMAESDKMLQGINIDNLPEGVKEFRFNTLGFEVGETMNLSIKDLEFEKEYYFCISGRDYMSNYSEFSPIKAIMTEENLPPVIRPMQDMDSFRIKQFEKLSLSFDIYDPEGDEVSVSLSGNKTGASIQKNVNGYWTLTITGSLLKTGTYESKITVSDKHGLKSDYIVIYQILENSSPISLQDFADLYVEQNEGIFTFELSDYFSDSDGESLTYTISDSTKGVSESEISGNTLTVNIVGYGHNILTVKAYDAIKASCTLEMRIMVKDPQNLVELYPIPVTDILNIRTGQEKETEILIKSESGHIVYSNKKMVSAFDPAIINMENCAPGKYSISVTISGMVTEKVISKI